MAGRGSIHIADAGFLIHATPKADCPIALSVVHLPER